MPSCVLCGSESFDEFDGLFYCEQCGTQSQEIRNEADVEEELDNCAFGTSQQKRQMKKKRSGTSRRSKYPPTDFGKPWLTFEAFQCLLKAQVSALVELGVNPALKEIVQQIWFRFLNRKNVAFTAAKEGSSIAFKSMIAKRDRQPGTPSCPMPGEDLKYKTKETNAEDPDLDFWGGKNEDYGQDDDIMEMEDDIEENTSNESVTDSDSESTDDSDEKQAEHIGSIKYKVDSKYGWAKLQHKPLTIVIVYLGLLYANEPITIADLLRLIAKGRVPYYKISDVLPGHMKFSKEDTSCFMNVPVRLPAIHEGATLIINFLDLPPIPEPDFHLIIAKLVIDLQLPAAVHRLSLALFTATGFKPRTNFYRLRQVTCSEFYEEMAMAFIIVALKLIYGLDGCKERTGKILQLCLDVSADKLDCWGCIALRLQAKRKDFVQNTYLSKEEDVKYIKDCANYALFCSEEVFKNSNASQASKMKTAYVHSQYRACRSSATEMYSDIMKHAVEDIENGKLIETSTLNPSSFLFKRTENGEFENVDCKCKSTERFQQGAEVEGLVGESSSTDEDSNDADDDESYLIYFDGLAGLNVHDSFKFLLNFCAERILIRQNEMNYYVQQVESMLFILKD